MPTYEFRCSNGHTFDQFHKISDAPSTAVCPICGALAERAISGGAGLVFKGSGFYLTDYGKNAHRGGSAPAAKGGEGGGEGKGEGKSDVAPKSSGSDASSGGAGGTSSGSTGGPKPSTGGSGSTGGSSSGGSSSGGSSSGGSSSGGSSSGGAA